MKTIRYYNITILLIILSCNSEQKPNQLTTYNSKYSETNGFNMPDSVINKPKIIYIRNLKSKQAGKPNVIYTNTNVYSALETRKYLIENTKQFTIYRDSFLLPKSVPAVDVKLLASLPEVVIAKDPYIKEQNTENFSIFNKLQGLKHDVIRCMIQDRNRNIWIGTDGGATKYDGKYFSHFTEKEGLSNNIVCCILEDKNGNIWFGTYGGGVTKFDGKYFTNYTTKEGLNNNYVISISEDTSGFIWIGTLGGGVSKFDGNIVESAARGERISVDLNELRRINGKLTKSFTGYTQKEGLIQNNVYCILEDKLGNLWFGTNGGVSVYFIDPVTKLKSFKHYSQEDGLCSNYVRSIFEDSDGNIWFGTEEGVSKFDGNLVDAIKNADNPNLEKYRILNKINQKYIKSFTNYTEKGGLSNNRVYSILQDKIGNIWFGTYGGGISKLETKKSIHSDEHSSETNQSTFTHFTEKEGLSNSRVFSILQDFNGNLWFGTDGGGVSKYDGNLFKFFTQKEGLINNRVIGIIQDKKGNLWFGTNGGGVAKYDGKSFVHYTEKEGLCDNKVISILQDNDGNLWFGTYSGGVSKFDGKYFTNYSEKDGLSNNCIYCIYQDKIGNIWFGTESGVTKYDGNLVESLERGEVNSQKNKQYLHSLNGKLVKTFTHYTANEGIVNSGVYSIFEDYDGNFWFGTDFSGVIKYDGKSFTRISKKEGLSSNYVVSIFQDKSGNFWIGTLGGGVTMLSFKNENGTKKYKLLNFSEKEDLSNNSVFSIMEDKNKNLWFGTRFGLNKLSQKNLANYFDQPNNLQPPILTFENNYQPILFKNFTYENGFLGIGCNRSAILEDQNGSIWIGANDRLTVYYPNGDKTDSIPPNIQLTNIELFNESISWIDLINKKDTSLILGNGITVGNFSFDSTSKWYGLPVNLSLKHNNNYLTFKFIGITQNQSKKVKYQYKLTGLDDNWSSPTLKNEASYGNLPQGFYIFKVRAMNSEGYWSKELSYSFSIRPPWWNTLLFKILITSFFIACLYIFYRWRIASLKKLKEQLEQTVKEKTSEVLLQKTELEKINEQLEVTLSSLKNAQNQLIQSEKMASLGILAAGVAHEINNPLNFIQAGIVGIETNLKENYQNINDETRTLINAIKVGVGRAASIVTSLNLYSHKDGEKKKECNLHEIIDNCLIMLNSQIIDRIEIIKNYRTDMQVISGNEGKLHQAMLNILANSVQAIEGIGTIHISTWSDKERINISIEDTGYGIEEANLLKIFDPFFTTKDPGKGTGLGLSITYNIIKEHQGSIDFSSTIGTGTIVNINFPLNKSKSYLYSKNC